MATITKDTIIAEILQQVPEAGPVFASVRMGCLGCAIAHGETLEQACAVHGVDVDMLLDKLNELADAKQG